MKPNRVAVYLTALAGLAGALAPVVANLDTRSTVGVLGGLATILTVAVKWLDGWQKHEARQPSQSPTADEAAQLALAARQLAAARQQLTVSSEGARLADQALARFGVDVDDAEPDDEHPDAIAVPATDPTSIPADQGDIGGQ